MGLFVVVVNRYGAMISVAPVEYWWGRATTPRTWTQAVTALVAGRRIDVTEDTEQSLEDAKNALDIINGFVKQGREGLDAIEAQIPTLKKALGLDQPPL